MAEGSLRLRAPPGAGGLEGEGVRVIRGCGGSSGEGFRGVLLSRDAVKPEEGFPLAHHCQPPPRFARMLTFTHIDTHAHTHIDTHTQ